MSTIEAEQKSSDLNIERVDDGMKAPVCITLPNTILIYDFFQLS